MTNQYGDELISETIYSAEDFNEGELAEAILLLAERLEVKFVRTNATKSGAIQLDCVDFS